MAGQKFTLTFDANLNVSQMKGALAQVESALTNLRLPPNIGKGLTDTYNKLARELQNFESITNKGLNNQSDLKAMEKSGEQLLKLYKLLEVQIKDLGKLSPDAMKKLFPDSVQNQIKDGDKALKNYKQTLNSLNSSIKSAEKSIQSWNDKLTARKNAKTTLETALTALQQEAKTIDEIAKSNGIKQQINDEKELSNAIDEAKKKLEEYYEKVKIGKGNTDANGVVGRAPNLFTEKALQNQITRLEATRQAWQDQESAISAVESKIRSVDNTINQANNKIAEFTVTLNRLKASEGQVQSDALTKLFQDLNKAGFDTSKYTQDLKGAEQAVRDFEAAERQAASGGIAAADKAIRDNTNAIEENARKVRECLDTNRLADQQYRDVDALKSRIQYFFGLNNAINLFRRSVRSAFNTIKELDKAMTETAVVTDFSVADMWKQLPEYTKRANELGVTTKAAYEAATLYYQQGLKTNEVMAMSNETLKMARIAGLDAATATDRMTNAIRGFNMEINTVNAQRIDDVYSRLAAISASNVDEISTAMTKVASLAHNANMEFETTAAFLAQIIETTRESAETAGTALKTVVARFSEVKKLVSEGELSGEDEEGELIDVNKVSQALRTAGIGLNKYFLGQVGLDDIFMELASKWNSLTTLQQRYIATQAAGSRQQSRFIALMSDYARTQELVGEAYNANGAAAKQFAKTQESLESKLAKLKNAWNEFAMGIINSDLAKAGVDFLTNLLNGVNALTSGFGTLNDGIGSVINSLLKLGVAIAGLNLAKGLVNGALYGAMAGIMGAPAGMTAGDVARASMVKSMLGANASATMTGLASKGTGGIVAAGLLNPFMGIGSLVGKGAKGVWGGAKALGTFMGVGTGIGKGALASSGGMAWLAGTGGAAAGVAGLATAIGGITIAAAAAYKIVKTLYDASPTGQIKNAQKYADAINEIATTAKKSSKDLQNVQEEYKQLNNAVNNASTIEERNEAIKSRTEYVKSLLEQNKVYSQYLSQDYHIENGELILTFDEDKLAQACKDIAEAAMKAQTGANLANANVAYQQWQKAVDELTKLSNQKNYLNLEGLSDQWTAELEQRLVQAYERATLYANQYSRYAMSASTGLFDNTDFDEQNRDLFTNALSQLIASTLNGDEIHKQISENVTGFWGQTRLEGTGVRTSYKEAVQAYLDAFPNEINVPKEYQEATKENTKALINLVAWEKIRVEQEKKNETLVAAFNGLSTEQQELLSDILVNGGRNLTWEEYQALAGGEYATEYAGIWDVLSESARNQIADTLKGGQLFENILPSLFNDFSDGILESLKQLTTDFYNNNNLTTAQTETVGQLFNTLAHIDPSLVEGFANTLSETIQNVPKDKLDDLFGALNTLDLTNAKSIKDFFKHLDDADIDISSFGNSVDDAANKLIDLTNAVQSFNLEKFKEKLISSLDIIRDVKDRKDYERTFAEDEFNTIMAAAGADRDDFWYTGISGAEYTYIGDDLNTIIKILQDQLKLDLQRESESLKQSIEQGKVIAGSNEKIGDDTLLAAMKLFVQNEDYDNDQLIDLFKQSETLQQLIPTLQSLNGIGLSKEFKGLIESALNLNENEQLLETLLRTYIEPAAYVNAEAYKQTFEEMYPLMAGANGNVDLAKLTEQTGGQLKLETHTDEETGMTYTFTPILAETGEELTPEAFWNYINTVVNSDNPIAADTKGLLVNMSANQDSDYVSQLQAESTKYSQRPDISDIEWGATAAHFKVDEEALNVYDQILKAIDQIDTANRNWNKTEQQHVHYARELSLAWSDQAKKLQEVQKVVDENDAVITATERDSMAYVSAIHEVGEAMRAAYGNYITDEFVEAHMKEITLARESEEAYHELLSLLQQEFFNAANESDEFRQVLFGVKEQMVDLGLTAESLNGLEIKGVAVLDDTPWMTVIIELFKAGASIRDFFDSLGWTVEYDIDKDTGLPTNVRLVRNNPGGPGGYNPYTGNGYGRNGGGGGSQREPTVWENDLDWLYNLMEDIAELQRQQTKLAEKHDRYLSDISKSGRDLYDITKEQLDNLKTEYDNQREALTRRRQELEEQLGTSGYTDYVWWNDEDKTIEIDWDAIEAIQNKDTYDEVKDLINKIETIQDQMDTAEDALWDIEGKIKELEDRYLQEYTEFQQRILDAVVASYQRQIDKLSSLNDTLNDTNAKILESLQQEIDYSRQIRDNTDTERNISDMEARLAYLRRDTTGANESQIRDLEKQLEDARQGYEDTLIDQSLERLSESNAQAAEQRQQQIDLLTAQLEYWQESGELWGEVAELMAGGIDDDGSLIRGSQLEEMLKDADSWKAMSQEQREVWANELINQTAVAGAYLIKISEGLEGISAGIHALIPETSLTDQKLQYASGGLNTKTGWAWLDGTASEPEYVLNARQTDAFMKLSEVLPAMFEGGGSISSSVGGDVYIELSMNIGGISSDYDVDRMVDRIKSDIYDASSFRNLTSISRNR